MSRKIEVQIIGDSKSLEAAMGRASKKTTTFGKTVQVASRVATGALLGLGAAAVIGFKEMEDSQKVAAQTNAVIKSTGGAANVTAKQVDDLAQSLLNKSGVDDEVIKSGENVLLTFRNIRNEAGKGNDIFTQSTKTALDLSVALNKDLQSSAILVGKALNDPVKGLTALRRVGVQFTAQQESQIKAMVKNGNVMGAQKLILGELNKEFGGSAKAAGGTLAGQINILKESFKNLTAELVTALLPAFKSIVASLQGVVGWMKQNETATKVIIIAIAALSAAVIVTNAAYKVWIASTRIVTAAQWLLNAALDANPIGLVIIGLVALGAALVVAYKKSKTFRDIVDSAWAKVKQAFEAAKPVAARVLNFIRDKLGMVINFVKGTLVPIWKQEFQIFRSVVSKAWDVIRPALSHLISFLGDVRDAVSWIKDNAAKGFNALKNAVTRVAGSIKNALSPIVNFLNDVIDKINWILTHIPDIPNPFGGGTSNNYKSPTNVKGGSNPTHKGTQGGDSIVIPIHIDGREVARAVVTQDKVYRRQSGRGLFA